MRDVEWKSAARRHTRRVRRRTRPGWTGHERARRQHPTAANAATGVPDLFRVYRACLYGCFNNLLDVAYGRGVSALSVEPARVSDPVRHRGGLPTVSDGKSGAPSVVPLADRAIEQDTASEAPLRAVPTRLAPPR